MLRSNLSFRGLTTESRSFLFYMFDQIVGEKFKTFILSGFDHVMKRNRTAI